MKIYEIRNVNLPFWTLVLKSSFILIVLLTYCKSASAQSFTARLDRYTLSEYNSSGFCQPSAEQQLFDTYVLSQRYFAVKHNGAGNIDGIYETQGAHFTLFQYRCPNIGPDFTHIYSLRQAYREIGVPIGSNREDLELITCGYHSSAATGGVIHEEFYLRSQQEILCAKLD